MLMRFLQLLVAAAVAVTAGCVIDTRSQPQDGRNNAVFDGRCASSGGTVPGHSVAPLDLGIATATQTIRWAAWVPKSSAVSKVRLLSGPCASQLVSFELDQLYFANPAAIVGELDGMTTHLPGESNARIGLSDPHPHINGWAFVYAELVEPMGKPGSVGSTYIGAWNRGSTGMLGYFKRTSEAGFSEPREVLTSSLPILSVSYFPYLHGGGGRLGLAQDAGTGIRLVSIEWAHPGL